MKLSKSPTVKHVVVLKRTGQEVTMVDGRDVWWHDMIADESGDFAPVPMDSESPLLYCIRVAQLENQKELSTQRPDIYCGQKQRQSGFLISVMMICSGALLIVAGLQVTVMSRMAH